MDAVLGPNIFFFLAYNYNVILSPLRVVNCKLAPISTVIMMKSSLRYHYNIVTNYTPLIVRRYRTSHIIILNLHSKKCQICVRKTSYTDDTFFFHCTIKNIIIIIYLYVTKYFFVGKNLGVSYNDKI